MDSFNFENHSEQEFRDLMDWLSDDNLIDEMYRRDYVVLDTDYQRKLKQAVWSIIDMMPKGWL